MKKNLKPLVHFCYNVYIMKNSEENQIMIKITAQHEKFIDAAAVLYPGQAEFS